MANTPPTIIALKQHFISSQILILSTPLQPSPAFESQSQSAETPTLRQTHVSDSLHKLNARIKKHNKLRYGPQAQRHVAEQIGELYWAAGERGVMVLNNDEEWVERGSDYRSSTKIKSLPPSWPEAESQDPDEAEKFSNLSQRLLELDEKREMAQSRLNNRRRLKDLVDSFTEEAGVQENLVGRNSEVELELERMRRLMARVERGMLGLGDGGGDMDVDGDIDVDGEEERKLLAILR